MLPLSKAKLKFFISLQYKKYRSNHRMFLAEGQKVLYEALSSSYPLEAIVLRQGEELKGLPDVDRDKVLIAGAIDFKKISTQIQPEGIIGVFRFPDAPLYQSVEQLDDLPDLPAFLIEDLRDPGNLGTLIRTADWFGFSSLICSASTVEVFNPKVVRAAMGSLFRLHITYVDNFQGFIRTHARQIWAADMNGTPLSDSTLSDKPMILMGNEAYGLSEELRSLPGLEKVSIPCYGKGESLNVGVAAGILAAQWRLG